MKKFLTTVVALALALPVMANNILNNDDVRQALYGALKQAEPALRSANFGKATIAILPMKAGHSILAGRLKNMITSAGFVCVEGKEDPMWDEILKEIAWDERKDDILDPATVVKFGKLKAANILMQCSIRVIDPSPTRVYAEIELHATDIATKQHIWGGSFAYRFYIGKDVQGEVRLDANLLNLLQKGFDDAKNSMRSAPYAGKLKNIKTVTVVPLTGDINGFLTQMATGMLTQTDFHPQNPRIPSMTQIRATARDGLLRSDAVFYGSVRDLHVTTPEESQVGKKIQISYNVSVNIQLAIEDVKNGNILWSKTVILDDTITSEREMTPEERKVYVDGKVDGIRDEIAEDFADNWKSYVKLAGIIIGAIILLIAAVIGIKAFVSYNNVR